MEHGRERVYARVVHDILSMLIARDGGGRPLNILEVGGGTGLLTRQLLDLAELPNVNYYFTDIGEYFINKAKDEPEFTSLRFKTFDISKNPAEQGLALHSFDVVLGLNVVHATKDIGGTLANLRQLLVPDGLMLLIEACKRLRWVDMVWGWPKAGGCSRTGACAINLRLLTRMPGKKYSWTPVIRTFRSSLATMNGALWPTVFLLQPTKVKIQKYDTNFNIIQHKHSLTLKEIVDDNLVDS